MGSIEIGFGPGREITGLPIPVVVSPRSLFILEEARARSKCFISGFLRLDFPSYGGIRRGTERGRDRDGR